MQATVFVATSVDGFIARPDGSLDWLVAPDAGDGDYGFADLLASVDALVMGRTTFEVARLADPWPYGDIPLIVLTHRDLDLPERLAGRVEAMAASPGDLVVALAGRGIERVYVDGGEVIQDFLRAGLVRRIIVTQLPVLIGTGIPLFGPLDGDVGLRLAECRSYANGWVQFEYEVP